MTSFFSFMDIVTLIDNIRFIRVFRYMSLMVYCSSLFVCEHVRKSQRINNVSWIESMIMCFMGQFGGTTIASILIGQPVRFLTSDKLVVAMLMAWLTIFWTPLDFGLKIFQNPIIRLICRFFQLLNTSFSVTAYGVDYVFKSDHPKAMVGLSMIIVTGTLSGCGGGILLRQYMFFRNRYFPSSMNDGQLNSLPDDLTRPTFPVKRAFFSTLLYIYLLDPLLFIRGGPLFDPRVCHVITFLFVLFTTVLKVIGWNVFDSISSLFHVVTQIPKDIPVFARRWSFEDIYEKEKMQ